MPNGTWVGSLTEFEGNKGYWFKVSEDFEFSFNIVEQDLIRTANPSIIKKYPEEMSYVQSVNQGFFFVEDILIIVNPVE